MRINLTLDHLPNQVLPINYHYLISSWIYNTIHQSDAGFSKWLHEQGFTLNGKRYKHFCYSSLKPTRYKVLKNNLFELSQGPTKLDLSFQMPESGKHLIKGVFQNQIIQLASKGKNVLFTIRDIHLRKPPVFENIMSFETISPVCVSVNSDEREHATYLNPTDEKFEQAFILNLINKANAFLGQEKYVNENIELNILTEKPRSKLYQIKNIKVRGYEFQFTLKAPRELIEIGYYAGFGTQNSSLGMGFCEVKKKN